jgi:hypothetical protein
MARRNNYAKPDGRHHVEHGGDTKEAAVIESVDDGSTPGSQQ